MASRKRMGINAAGLSDPSETDSPCGRCRTTPDTDPCEVCPLYGAFLERHGRTDDERSRAFYAAWRAGHGWRVRWMIGAMRRRSDERARVAAVVARFPEVLDRYPNYAKESAR